MLQDHIVRIGTVVAAERSWPLLLVMMVVMVVVMGTGTVDGYTASRTTPTSVRQPVLRLCPVHHHHGQWGGVVYDATMLLLLWGRITARWEVVVFRGWRRWQGGRVVSERFSVPYRKLPYLVALRCRTRQTSTAPTSATGWQLTREASGTVYNVAGVVVVVIIVVVMDVVVAGVNVRARPGSVVSSGDPVQVGRSRDVRIGVRRWCTGIAGPLVVLRERWHLRVYLRDGRSSAIPGARRRWSYYSDKRVAFLW